MSDKVGKGSTVEPYEGARRLGVFKQNKHVLIIDDQSTGRAILEQVILQIADNIKVTAFDAPRKALVWLDSNDPDLIVTDYRMPEMNGIEFIRHVRQKRTLSKYPNSDDNRRQ